MRGLHLLELRTWARRSAVSVPQSFSTGAHRSVCADPWRRVPFAGL